MFSYTASYDNFMPGGAVLTKQQQRGVAAEELACRYLVRQGLKLIERNYRCRVGELDVIMQDGAYRVFVEVRSRHHSHHGTAAETVTFTKQKRLSRAASYYLQRCGFPGPCRFDIIAITQQEGKPVIQWIKDAFHTI